MILAGLVFSGERKIEKAGQALAADAPLEVRGKDHPWVSRGGIKLAHALDHFGWDVAGAVALDVGASTGGFTDVLLQQGAAKVFAVDVGTNQLAWKLRQDPRVIVHEQTNARYLTDAIVTEPVDIIVCDASFIGLAKVLDTALGLRQARRAADRAGQAAVRGGAATRSAKAAWSAIRRCTSGSARRRRTGSAGAAGASSGVTQSPITGPEGNVEFLIAAEKARAAETL